MHLRSARNTHPSVPLLLAALLTTVHGCGDHTGKASSDPYDPEEPPIAVTQHRLCNNFCDPRDFGATPNDSTVDTAGLQAAINAAIQEGKPLVIPSGVFILNDTLFISSRAALGLDSQVALTVRGASGSFVPEGSTDPTYTLKETILYLKAPAGDRPALNIQGGNGVTLADFQIIGQNYAPGHTRLNWRSDSIAATISPDPNDWILKNRCKYANGTEAWSTCTTNAQCTQSAGGICIVASGAPFSAERYAPHAGIAVDAYSGAPPAGQQGYPTDGYLRAYGQYASTNLKFENLSVSQFVVGVALKPSNEDNNGEDINFDRVHLIGNTYGLSVGGSQERVVVFRDGAIAFSHTAITTVHFGRGIGQSPRLRDVNLGASYRAFSLRSDVGATSFDGLHIETIATLGEFGAGATGAFANAQISNSNIHFFGFDNYRAPFLFQSWQPLTFDNVNFGLVNSATSPVPSRPFTFIARGGCPGGCDTTFRGCTFGDHALLNDGGYRPFGEVGNQQYNVHIEGSDFTSLGTALQELNDEADWSAIPSRLLLAPNVRRLRTWFTGEQAYSLASATPYSGRPTVSVNYNSTDAANNATTLVFDRIAGAPQTLFPGDWVYWRVLPNTPYEHLLPVLKVASVTATRVTLTKTVSDLDPTYFPTTTPTQISVEVLRPSFVNAVPATFTWAAGATTLTRVSGATSNFAVGDFVQAAGLAANTRILAIAANSVTVNQAASAAGTNLAVVNTVLTPATW